MEEGPIELLVIVGPTAAGKSRLALAAALELDAEIVSADSVQVYRHMDVGSAKPSAADLDRVNHWCIDLVEPTASFDAASWVDHASEAIRTIAGKGKLPIVVGGTGFYIRALLSGLHEVASIKPEIREAVRNELENYGSAAMHDQLARVDPEAAARILPTDPQRIGRALEVYRSTGRPLSEHFREERSHSPYRAITIGLWPPRAILYEAINRRARAMLREGLVEEVRHLLALGVKEQSGPLASLGYRQVCQHLRGEITREELAEAIATGHRKYARRQMTWFRGITTRENQLIHIDPSSGKALDELRGIWANRVQISASAS